MAWNNLESEVRSQTRRRGPQCTVGALLERVAPDAKTAINKVLADSRLTNAAIYRALVARVGDDSPGQWAIGNHRRGDCACGRRS